jgi:hypothetical protein
VGLRDVTGVFSRFFVVGFFVPSFVVSLALAALFVKLDRASEVYVAGGVALVAALVLVGLRQLVWEAFEDVPQRSYFGRKTHEYHCRIRVRWGLDVYRAWPVIQPLFNERERELDIDGRSDVHFFLNSCLGTVFVAVGLFVDASTSPFGAWWASALLGLAALGGSALAYIAAAHAVMPWGDFKEAAVIHHRSELYALFGLASPVSRDEERAAALRVNALLQPPNDDRRGWRRRPCPDDDGG